MGKNGQNGHGLFAASDREIAAAKSEHDRCLAAVQDKERETVELENLQADERAEHERLRVRDQERRKAELLDGVKRPTSGAYAPTTPKTALDFRADLIEARDDALVVLRGELARLRELAGIAERAWRQLLHIRTGVVVGTCLVQNAQLFAEGVSPSILMMFVAKFIGRNLVNQIEGAVREGNFRIARADDWEREIVVQLTAAGYDIDEIAKGLPKVEV